MRAELTRVAESILEFISKVSLVKWAKNDLVLLSERAYLLNLLESWLTGLELVQAEISPPGPELLSVTFMRFFYLVLKIVLLGALDSSPDLCAKLQAENGRLQDVASNLTERVKSYQMRAGTGSGQGKRVQVG
jgi:hypothetical protein